MPEHAIMEPEKKSMSRDEFFSAVRPKSENFDLAGFGTVVIQPITLKDREEIRSGSINHAGKVDEAAWMSLTILKGLVDPKLTPQDVAQIQQSSFGHLRSLSERIWVISGIDIGGASEEKAKNA